MSNKLEIVFLVLTASLGVMLLSLLCTAANGVW